MSLVEEYYEMNESKEVSATWKALQIIFYACAACLGLACGFVLGILRAKFDNRCYLFTEVKIAPKGEKIEQSNINWESDTRCDYYQFSMVCSFIVGIIWATLFLMCGKGGKSLTGLPQPWRIVWPSLIFNLIYFIIALSTAISIQQGTTQFCARYYFDNSIHTKLEPDKCPSLKMLVEKKDFSRTSIKIQIVLITAWSCVLSWLILFLLSLFRIVFAVDFCLYKICVFKIDDTVQNKTEEVLRITNYEEPRKLYYDKDEDNTSFSEPEEDVEAGTRKRVKIDRKLIGRYYRAPVQANTAFYVTGDIRMLRREKKRDKSSKALNEAFGKNDLRVEFKKATKIQSNMETSAQSEVSKFLYPYSENLHVVEDNETEISSFPGPQKSDFDADWSDSGSESENFIDRFESCHSLRSKKHL